MQRFFARFFGSPRSLSRRPLSASSARRDRPTIETLEDRCVPATLQIVNGLLTYTAGAGIANNLKIAVSGTNYVFTDTKETIGAAGLAGSGTNSVIVPTGFVGSMLINLGDKADAFVIEATVDAITVKGGADNDTIDVGKFVGGALSAIQADVTVDGETGTDALRVNDPVSGASRTYTVTATRVTPTGGSDVNYAGVERLTVTAGALADTFTVRGTAAGTTTTLNAGAGFDTFNVGSTTNTLGDVKGPLVLNGGSSFPFPLFLPDTVNLFDQGSAVANSYTVRDNSVARSGSVVVSFKEVEKLTLNAGSAADSVGVLATSAGTPVTLNLGGGNDVVNLGTRTGTALDPFFTPVTVNGEAGTDTIVLNDQVANHVNFFVVTSTDVTRNFTKVLNYSTSESLTLNAGNFADSVSVQSTLAATSVTLKMGGGDDTVSVGSATNSLDPILGSVSVDGQAGSDQLTLNDQGDGAFNDYTVTATAVSRAGAAPVAYAGLENLTVNAGSGPIILFSGLLPAGNHFFVKSTSTATTLNGGDIFVSSFFIVGSDGNSLDGIQGALAVNGGGTLVLNDQGDTNANSYTVTSTSVSRTGAALISYKVGFNQGLTINAGASNDTVAVKSTSAEVVLNMGGGNDSVTLGSAKPLFNSLGGIGFVTVHGQGGTDSILLNDADSGVIPVAGQNYRFTSSGVTSRNFAFSLTYDTMESLELRTTSGADTCTFLSTAAATPVVVRSGFGNDTFKFGSTTEFVTNAASLLGAVTLDGQGGTDTLDYSAFTVGVRVNLAAGTATGAAGGVSNIENVTGGSANDILIGNDLANVLRGGPGRDILIGRGGADALFGETGDDILIGASTVHDLIPARIEDLMREWGRTDLFGTLSSQYATRIIHLIGVGDLNGTTRLDFSAVVEDGNADSLDGGTELDWFFKLGADSIAALGATERVN